MTIVEVGIERPVDQRALGRPTLRVATVEVLECCVEQRGDDDYEDDYGDDLQSSGDADLENACWAERLLSPHRRVLPAPVTHLDDRSTARTSDDLYSGKFEARRGRPPSPGGRKSKIKVSQFWARGFWLVSLLALQSCSSWVLQRFQPLLLAHPCIVVFLTMLVGAGGNAGSQTTVLTVRAIAGNRSAAQMRAFIRSELMMAVKLAGLMAAACYVRVEWFDGGDDVTPHEAAGLCLATFAIVLVSIAGGLIMPLLLHHVIGCDPAHAGAAIQVFADIVGVTLACVIMAAAVQATKAYRTFN